MYNNYTYVIVDSSDIDSLNFGVDEKREGTTNRKWQR